MPGENQRKKLKEALLAALNGGQDFVLFHLPDSGNVDFYRGNFNETATVEKSKGFLAGLFSGEKYFLTLGESLEVALDDLNDLPEIQGQYIEKTPHTASRQEYYSMIDKALQEINAGIFQKVVLSRVEKQQLPDNLNYISLFHSLCSRYPSAFVYYLHSEKLGCWMGSSPELLLNKKGQELETMALAGTSAENDEQEAAKSFKAKETEEQGWVSRYIEEKLAPIAKAIEKEGPKIRRAGNLFHLYTHFKATLQQEQDTQAILDVLHPTPAVGGYPASPAMEFILKNEGYERELYSGYLGPVSANGDASLYVNLRCMQFTGENEALFYAGGGIVKGSVPEKEWEETRQKMQTLLQVIHE